MKHRYLAGPLAALVMVAALPGTGALASYVSPRSLVLTTADLPGYQQTSAKFVSNAQMASRVHLSRATFDSHGRITGYQAEFQKSGHGGVAFIASYAYMYRSAAGATWDYGQSVSHDLKQLKRMSAPTIGDASTGYGGIRVAGKNRIALFGINFRRGTADMTIGVGGLQGQVHMSDAVRLAQIMVHRAG